LVWSLGSEERMQSERSTLNAERSTTIIGVDPGLRATGFAVLEMADGALRLEEWGEIRSAPRQSLQQRLAEVFAGMEAVLEQWRPRSMVLEKLYSEYHFPYTAILMGHVRGAICLAAYRAGVEVIEIPPTEAKRALCGFGRASKPQVGLAVARLLGLSSPPRSEHVADALALAIVGALRHGLRVSPIKGVRG